MLRRREAQELKRRQHWTVKIPSKYQEAMLLLKQPDSKVFTDFPCHPIQVRIVDSEYPNEMILFEEL